MNLLKPKKTTFNAKALVYRRFSRLEKSRNMFTIYKCQKNNGDYRFYEFDAELQEFVETNVDDLVSMPTIITVTDATKVFQSGTNYFYWNKTAHNGNGAWVKVTSLTGLTYTTLENAGFSNIGKYQTNAYYFIGAIDYVITGEVAGTKTQTIKGNIMPLRSMNIKYYDDYIGIDEEDLIVIDGALYSIESPDYTIKHFPRPYKIYYATLNSIL